MRFLLSLLATVLLLFSAAGCGNDANPTGPAPGNGNEPPEEEILTPSQVRITSIRLDEFPDKKGAVTWDASLSVASRRPDPYVAMRTGSTSSAPIFVSVVKEDAFSFTFIDLSESSAGAGLPKLASAGRDLTFDVLDDDDFSADDEMGSMTVNPLNLYGDDNAAGFTWTLVDSGVKLKVSGTWIY